MCIRDRRKTARQVKVEPLLDAYWWWLEKLEPVPGSKLAEAVTYAKNQKPYLNAFLDHGEVDISNNFAENAIRPFVVDVYKRQEIHCGDDSLGKIVVYDCQGEK